jgi:hypothetical protein
MTLVELPSRAKDRSDKLVPTSTKISADKDLPSLDAERMENEDPHPTSIRTLQRGLCLETDLKLKLEPS